MGNKGDYIYLDVTPYRYKEIYYSETLEPNQTLIDLRKYTVDIGSKQILTFNRKPTGQDDCFIPVGEANNSIVYSNNVTSTTIASQTI